MDSPGSRRVSGLTQLTSDPKTRHNLQYGEDSQTLASGDISTMEYYLLFLSWARPSYLVRYTDLHIVRAPCSFQSHENRRHHVSERSGMLETDKP